MKSQKIFIALIALFASLQICHGQKKQTNLSLIDSVIEPNCEYLLNRLDYLVGKTLKNSQSIGYVVIQGGANPIQNKFYEKFARNYPAYRNFDKSRYVVITSKSKDELKIDFLISNDVKTKPDVIAQDFTYFLPIKNEPILFQEKNAVEVEKIDGELTILDFCPVCCIEGVNLDFLSKFLNSNSQLNANIKIYSNSRRRAKQLEKLVRDELTGDYKIPITRLKFIYGGVDEGISQLTTNISSVEIKLVSVK